MEILSEKLNNITERHEVVIKYNNEVFTFWVDVLVKNEYRYMTQSGIISKTVNLSEEIEEKIIKYLRDYFNN